MMFRILSSGTLFKKHNLLCSAFLSLAVIVIANQAWIGPYHSKPRPGMSREQISLYLMIL